MENRVIHANIYELMEKRLYRLIVPESYSPRISRYCKDNDIPPIYQQQEGEAVTLLPIADIIDMTYYDIPFDIKYSHLIEVVSILERYINLKNKALGGFDIKKLAIDIEMFFKKCTTTYEKLNSQIMRKDRKKATITPISDLILGGTQ